MEDVRSRIRAARRGDVPALVDLRVQFLGEAVHDEPRLRLLPDVRERTEHALPVWMEQRGRLLLVAEAKATDDEAPPPIVGYAMGTVDVLPPLFEHQHVGTIAECYVSPAARGEGLSRALVDLLAEMLGARESQVLRVAVPVGHEEVLARLVSEGFDPVQHTMARPLSSD